jgi:hypothetical protein
MGCGCNKKGNGVRRAIVKPIGPRPVQGGAAAGPNPTEIRALGLQKNLALGETRQMDDQRRRIEKLRRDAIRRHLGK